MVKENAMQQKRTTIGRAEKIDMPEFALSGVPARIDTGAKTSSIWASNVQVKDGVLAAVLFGEQSEFYTGKPVHFQEFEKTVVSTSTGKKELRYKVLFKVRLKGRNIRARFTLADRSQQVYPVLIGRNVLAGKFIVDVKKGRPLKEAERHRTEQLRSELNEFEG